MKSVSAMRPFSRTSSFLCAATIALVFVGAPSAPTPLQAEPTTADPASGLAVRPHEKADELLAAALKLHADAAGEVAKYVEEVEAGKAKAFKPIEVGKTSVKVSQAWRAANRLTQLGEAAGVDLEYRVRDVQQQISSVVRAYKTTPEGTRKLAQGIRVLKAECEKKGKSLPRIDKLIAEEKWEQAEETLHEIFADLDPMAIWYEDPPPEYDALLQRLQTVEGRLSTLRRESALAALTAARDAELPDYAGRLKEMADAATGIGETGEYPTAGDNRGPAAIAWFFDCWRRDQLQAARRQALGWALKSMSAQGVDTSAFLAAQRQHHTDVVEALAAIVEADAARVDAAAAEELYPRYLRELASGATSTTDPAVAARFQAALDKLAAKSPTLSADVAAYREATVDVLRWRRRIAEAQAQRRLADHPPADRLVRGASGPDGSNFGLVYSPASKDLFGVGFNRPAPAVVAAMGAALLDKGVAVSGVVRDGEHGDRATSVCGSFVYSVLPSNDVLAEAGKGLAADLLIADAAPPLSMEAAIAMYRVQFGEAAQVGGRIEEVTLESAIPRIAGLSEADWGLMRLDPLPAVEDEAGFGRRLLVRLTLRPEWVRHDCIFVVLPAME